jgi:hypothetical protein
VTHDRYLHDNALLGTTDTLVTTSRTYTNSLPSNIAPHKLHAYTKQKCPKTKITKFIDAQFPSYEIICNNTLHSTTCLRCPFIQYALTNPNYNHLHSIHSKPKHKVYKTQQLPILSQIKLYTNIGIKLRPSLKWQMKRIQNFKLLFYFILFLKHLTPITNTPPTRIQNT